MNVNDVLASHGIGIGKYRFKDKVPVSNFENDNFMIALAKGIDGGGNIPVRNSLFNSMKCEDNTYAYFAIEGGLIKLDINSGSIIFITDIGREMEQNNCVDIGNDGYLYVGGSNYNGYYGGPWYAQYYRNGVVSVPKFKIDDKKPLYGMRFIGNSRAVCVTDTSVYCVDFKTKSRVWSYTLPTAITNADYASVIVDNYGNSYAVCNKEIKKFDLNGNLQWTISESSNIYPRIYLSSDKQYLYYCLYYYSGTSTLYLVKVKASDKSTIIRKTFSCKTNINKFVIDNNDNILLGFNYDYDGTWHKLNSNGEILKSYPWMGYAFTANDYAYNEYRKSIFVLGGGYNHPQSYLEIVNTLQITK